MGAKTIAFCNKNGQVIIERKLTSLPIKEDSIIKISSELFNDCEPCIIHRTFIMKKIYLELDEYLNNMLQCGKSEICFDLIPSNVVKCLDIDSNEVFKIKVK